MLLCPTFGVQFIFPHWTREVAIDGILLLLTVPNEFHGKYFLCVSAYFEIGASGSGSLPVVTGTRVSIAVWTTTNCDKRRHLSMSYCQL